MSRKVVQIAAAMQAPFGTDDDRRIAQEFNVIALCDDGSIWTILPDQGNASWSRLPEIPQGE